MLWGDVREISYSFIKSNVSQNIILKLKWLSAVRRPQENVWNKVAICCLPAFLFFLSFTLIVLSLPSLLHTHLSLLFLTNLHYPEMIQKLFPLGDRNDSICYFTHGTLIAIKKRNEDLNAGFRPSGNGVRVSVRDQNFLESIASSGLGELTHLSCSSSQQYLAYWQFPL